MLGVEAGTLCRRVLPPQAGDVLGIAVVSLLWFPCPFCQESEHFSSSLARSSLCLPASQCSSSGPPLSFPSSLLSRFLLGELFTLFGGNLQQLISLLPGNVLHRGLLPHQAAVTTQACAVAPGLVAADPACPLVPDLCIAAWHQALQAARGLIPRDVPAGIHPKRAMDTSQVRE